MRFPRMGRCADAVHRLGGGANKKQGAREMEKNSCLYCITAFSDRELDEGSDFSSVCLSHANGVSVFVTSCSQYHPPVCIEIMEWNEKYRQNFSLKKIPLRYCPFCGRRIEENTPYLQ